ncbi:E3 ubiquitin-protein ligase rnf8-B [Halyomorpha halys]|uniref:E3 ubiquitin-protein ligase rnf8-B n=1 Tax=Halyomorpha halys TaxID=286706 RepID=UPI0006D50409|nr:E3 ubiquitin-protein ligase rnf8-B [Halyomorpha halys]
MTDPVIVNSLTCEILTFRDVEEITIGRNAASSIDIPSPVISRTQCVIKPNENNEWFLTDLSRHHTTLFNNVALQGNSHILKSGDKISFLHYKDGEYVFYKSIFDVPNKTKKRKLETLTDFTSDILTPNPADVKNSDQNQILSQNNVIAELNKELALLKEKYDLALEEIDNQRRVNETVSHRLNLLMTESNDRVSSLQKEKELLNNKLKEEEISKEKMKNEIQELNELLKESELEQIRLNDECKCKELSSYKSIKQDEGPKVSNEVIDLNETVTTSEALQKLVEIVEIKWNEQEMEHMRDQLKLRDEKLTDMALESEKYQSQVIETLDREMLCSICNDIIYEATTLNCRHTFCRVCLFEWKKKKKECPVCRAKIKTETRPLVIDSFIDKLADTVGGELKTRRMEVKEERTSKPIRGASSYSNRTSPYNRNNRRTRGNFNTISSAMSILQPLVIELSDHFGTGIPESVIDLTASPAAPRQRRRRQASSYYHM